MGRIAMKLFEKEKHENAKAYALRMLKHNIISLHLKPGELVSENEISALLGLSRTPVREALIELSRAGLVDIMPQRGSYISKIDYNIINEAHFMREVLENAILKLVCENIPKEYLDKLKENVEQQKICLHKDDMPNLLKLDDKFHKLLFESVGRNWTYNVIKSQMMNFDRLRNLILKSIKSDRIIEDHENILYAIGRCDFELAEILMSRHIQRYRVDKDELINLYPSYFK